MPWQLTLSIADDMRAGRIFLTGDAAHTMTPYAGKGANAGIQDVQNLAWKLAAVLKNNAGEALLETYDLERQPVGAYYASLSGELAGENGLINDTLMFTKGKEILGVPNYICQSSAIIHAPTEPFSNFNGQPGTRLPHLWLDENRQRSSIDWIAGRFTLIANEPMNWQSEIDEVYQRTGIKIHFINLANHSVSKAWQEQTATQKDEALLVRPDDFVAARLCPKMLFKSLQQILWLTD